MSAMNAAIGELIGISRFYGQNKEFVIGGGGNTSWKDEHNLYVKASGARLGDLTEQGIVRLDREAIKRVYSGTLPDDAILRDQMLVKGLLECCVDNEAGLRPSVETPLHNLLNYRFVIHTHPTRINALLCSQECEPGVRELFPETVLFIEYSDPGYLLYKKLEAEISAYRGRFGQDPKIILVSNHGVFISADTTEEIREIYDYLIRTVTGRTRYPLSVEPLPVSEKCTALLPAIRMLLSEDKIRIAKIRNNSLIEYFTADAEKAGLVSLPFTPDNIVYCKARPLYLEAEGSEEDVIREFREKLDAFRRTYGYSPKIILIRGIGLVSVEESSKMAGILLDVFEDLMKISWLSRSFGGPHFLPAERISFIENWESENYRHKISAGSSAGKVVDKIIVVTGAAQGFGGGIAEDLFRQGANVVIADLNEARGQEFADQLSQSAKNNKALFVRTDVSNPVSVQNLIHETVREFGGLDVIISNAGILHAGGLDEMSPETFELMTRVNYTGYFLCAKYASAVLKLQAAHKKGYFTDIIQINSKSGLRGSKKNFTYAGGKFGGVGLTQSFALELMPYRIKVNSICPGNFFDGPLWSDPERGLFVQYLRSGKVPGAKSVEDVKRYYESQVPAGRGCTVQDVMRAVYYVMEQEYETGQAIPVTGGQVMLS